MGPSPDRSLALLQLPEDAPPLLGVLIRCDYAVDSQLIDGREPLLEGCSRSLGNP